MNKIIIIHFSPHSWSGLVFDLVYSHKTVGKHEKSLNFIHEPRFDSLKSISMTEECIKETYGKREDL